MRSATKLRELLQHYSLAIDGLEDGTMQITMVDKSDPDEMHSFQGKSFSIVIGKAWTFKKKMNSKR